MDIPYGGNWLKIGYLELYLYSDPQVLNYEVLNELVNTKTTQQFSSYSFFFLMS